MSEAAVEATPEATPTPVEAVPEPTPTPSTFDTMVGSLPEDLRTAPIWDEYKERGFEGLAKDHLNLQSVLGSTERVNLPNADSPPEAWANYREKMGIPENAGAYDLGEFAPPEGLPWDDGRVSKLAEAAHAANLSNEQWQALVNADAAYQSEQWQAQAADLQSRMGEATEALKAKYGDTFDARMELAEQYGLEKWGDDFQKLMNVDVPGMGRLGNIPQMVEMLMDLGQETKAEDTLEKGDTSGNPFAGLTPASAQQRIEELNATHRELLTSNDAARKGEREAVQRQLDTLYKIAWPGTGNLY